VSGKAMNPTVDLPEPPPEQYPRLFGNYVLLGPLARGGMGEVFLAKHGSVAGLEKHCVVKTLRPHLTDDREYTTRFIDEARIVVQLGHRNICHVFDVGTVGERYYLAMEYIAGKDLRTVAHTVGERGGVLNRGLALHVVCETLEALAYAHRHVDAATGTPLLLVHRDVSPQNVMLSWEGEVKLIDFGLAASTLKMEQTSPNVVMGKLAYMAPEQVRGEKVDGRADQFAAAVVLYELLVGERFYEGKSPYEIWGIAAQGGYRPRGFGSLDAELKPILDRALAASTEQRYETCLAFRDALQKYRYARSLHGDGPLLRGLMHDIYGPEIEESRRTLAVLTQAKPRDPAAPQAEGAGPLSPEPTVSLARSPSLSLANRSLSAAEGTEPTNAMRGPAPAHRRVPGLAAALLLVVALAGVAAGSYFLGQERAPAAEPPQPALLAAAPALGGAAEPPGDEPSAALAEPDGNLIAAPAVEAPEPDLAQPARDIEAPPDAERKKRRREREPREPWPGAERPAPAGDGVEATAAAEPKGEPLSFRSRGWRSRVEVLEERCAALACTSAAAAHKDDFGRLSQEDRAAFESWADGVRRCWSSCGLPGPT
jgi:eukaryotic-like serine/threonine-protein kinase